MTLMLRHSDRTQPCDRATEDAPRPSETDRPPPAPVRTALAMLGIGLGGLACSTDVPDEHEQWLGIG
jgi:hypothetical protein